MRFIRGGIAQNVTTYEPTGKKEEVREEVGMPKLQRRDYYDTARDMNWAFSYVSEDEVFPEELTTSFGIKGMG
jgi:hypothetical protein